MLASSKWWGAGVKTAAEGLGELGRYTFWPGVFIGLGLSRALICKLLLYQCKYEVKLVRLRIENVIYIYMHMHRHLRTRKRYGVGLDFSYSVTISQNNNVKRR